MTDYSEHENFSNVDKHQENDDENGIVEYLEIDSEVMETLQDPNDYFGQVNQSHEGHIYVQQNSTNSQQLSLVIQNSTGEFSSLKQLSPQQFESQNGTTSVLWSNNIIHQNNDRRSINDIYNSKGQRKRKKRSSESSDTNPKHVNQRDLIITTKEQAQSESDSLDLFFESMAQTVSHLPSQIQAKIKMDICKVISMAEIKYCSQQTIMRNSFNDDHNDEN